MIRGLGWDVGWEVAPGSGYSTEKRVLVLVNPRKKEWRSMSLMTFFVLSCFPRDVLDEIWDLIESVSEGFPIYSTSWRRFDIKRARNFDHTVLHFIKHYKR